MSLDKIRRSRCFTLDIGLSHVTLTGLSSSAIPPRHLESFKNWSLGHIFHRAWSRARHRVTSLSDLAFAELKFGLSTDLNKK